MEQSEETEPNLEHADTKHVQNTIQNENTQKPATKKKFRNTVFATKMRNRRKEEKLKNIDSEEVLTSCKSVSVEVQRLASSTMPKVISTIENRNHRRRKLQWKKGKTRKRKKLRDPTGKFIDHNNLNEQNNGSEKNKHTSQLKTEEKSNTVENSNNRDELTSSVDKDTEKRQSSRHINSVFDEKCDHKNDFSEQISCRRTEPFIGKFVTKEARTLNIERFLKVDIESEIKHNNQICNDSQKDPINENEANNTLIKKQSNPKDIKDTENNKSENISKESNGSIEINTNLENTKNQDVSTNKENHKDKNVDTFITNTSIDSENMLTNQESNKSSKIVIDTKDNVKDVETSCRRTIPFVGKIPRKLLSTVPERPIEEKSSEQSTKSDSLSNTTNAKPHVSPRDKHAKHDLSKDVNAKSESSANENEKTDSLTEDGKSKSECSIDIKTKSNFPLEGKKGKSESSSAHKKTKSDSPLEEAKANLESSTVHKIAKSDFSEKDIDPKQDSSKPSIRIVSSSKDVSVNVTTILESSLNDTSLELNSSSKIPDNQLSTELNMEVDSLRITRNKISNVACTKRKDSLSTSCEGTETKTNSSVENEKSLPVDNLNLVKSLDNGDKEEIWSCQRTEPYVREIYHNCSRTLPFVRPADKVKTNEPGTSFDIQNTLSSEIITNRLHTNDMNIPTDEENSLTDSTADVEVNLDSSSKSDNVIHNGQWKFRRKRQLANSDDENEIESNNPSKKAKSISTKSTSSPIKKITASVTSPGRTICSLFSINCTEHAHHHYSNNTGCPISLKTKADVYILLTKLENMTDPLVLEYLKKTDLTYKTKEEPLSPSKDNYTIVESRTSLGSVKESSDSAATRKSETKDDSMHLPAAETESKLPEAPTQINEDNIQENQRKVTRSARASTESPILMPGKRKKHPVNYIENFSDTDSDRSASFSNIRTRSKSRGPTLRDRSKRRTHSGQVGDDNDKEVEEFSRIDVRSRTHSKGADDVNQMDTNEERPPARITRAKSRLGLKITDTPNDITSEITTPMRPKTPSAKLVNERLLESTKHDLSAQCQADEDELDKEMEEITRNCTPSVPESLGSIDEPLNTPVLSQSQTEYNNNDQTLTPKSKTGSTVSSGRKSRASRVGALSVTPKKALGTPVHSESVANTLSDASQQLVNSIRQNLITQLTSPKTSLSSTNQKNLTMGNLKVQLIKLETVCNSFKDYSASDIELLTNKYVDLLITSNFTSDTWQKPINYHRPVENSVEQIDSTNCVSENDSQNATQPTSPDVVASSAATPVDKKSSPGKTKDGVTNESSQQDPSSVTSLDQVIATLVDQPESIEQRDFGAVNISEALNVPSNHNDINIHEPIVELHEGESVSDLQVLSTISDNEIVEKDPKTVVINGTVMFVCDICNKIFLTKSVLAQHKKQQHKEADQVDNSNMLSAAETTSTPVQPCQKKSYSKGSSSAKKSTPKPKSKFRYSESLKCTICSVIFETKVLLFEHIMTHNEQELQEAFKKAKAKEKRKYANDGTSEDSDKDAEESALHEENDNGKKKNDARQRKSIDSVRTSTSSMDVDDVSANDSARSDVDLVVPTEHQVVDLEAINQTPTDSAFQKTITICSCHAHETTNQDLQIEMVLLCKTCNVIFRRRDCFEVHYRTSPECRRRRTNNEVTKMPKLFCSGCPCVLDTLMDMRSHLEMHARKNCQGTVTFICNICKVAFFGVGGIFYSHWFNHTKSPNFVASRYSFPKLSVVSVLEDSNGSMSTSKSQEGFFYIAEHVCRQCRLPFSSEPELQKHKLIPCASATSALQRVEVPESNRLQMIKLICDLCKKYYMSKENYDRHCVERNHLKTPITKFSRLPISPTEQAFMCSLCRAISKSLDEMKDHWKRVHSPVMELYTCKTCNIFPESPLTDYSYDKFERHCRMVHKSEVITCLVYYIQAPYVCHYCRFGFETEKSLKEHEAAHQKKVSQPTMTLPPIPTTHTTTLWVANEHVAPDGGRQIQPVYIEYPNLNGNVNEQGSVPLTNAVPSTQYNQQQLQIQTTDNLHFAQVPFVTNNVVPQVVQSLNVINDSVIRNNTATNTTPGRQQQQQQNVTRNPVVEEILIDSRSNSPVLDTATPATTSSGKSTPRNENAASPLTTRKSYMTIVNPNFESMLGNSVNEQANTRSPMPDKENGTSDGNATPTSSDSVTPQPFEVVLVTDDISEGEGPPAEDKIGDSSARDSDSASPSQQVVKENSETKSFLRVRSIAELQRMKIHLCAVCGQSFDTLPAFEQHSKTHETNAKPMLVTPPMVAPTNKRASGSVSSPLITQLQQQFYRLPNGQISPNQADLNKRMSPSIATSYHQQQQQQQQHQKQPNYWIPSSNGTNANGVPSVNYNYGMNQQQSQLTQQSLLRQAIATNYTSPRGPPPAYPGSSGTMVSSTSGSIVSSRPSTIQSSHRNLPTSLGSLLAKPAAASTFSQQSLPSFQEITNNHQSSMRMPYNSRYMGNEASVKSPMISALLQQKTPQLPGKSYLRQQSDLGSYASNGRQYSAPQHQQQQQQQQQQKILYTCKIPTCPFRSDNVNVIRTHEKGHCIPSFTAPSNQIGQMQPPQPPQQQQQRFPVKHVSVNQIPERPRHGVSANRSAMNTSEKRYTCRICHLSFGLDTELVEHVTTLHNTPTSPVCCYVCDYCPSPILFDSEELLRQHIRVTHNYSCRLCNKRYPSQRHLADHMETHT